MENKKLISFSGFLFSLLFFIPIISNDLIGSGNNKRYTYDAGADPQLVPNSIGWVEEPRTFGFRLTAEF